MVTNNISNLTILPKHYLPLHQAVTSIESISVILYRYKSLLPSKVFKGQTGDRMSCLHRKCPVGLHSMEKQRKLQINSPSTCKWLYLASRSFMVHYFWSVGQNLNENTQAFCQCWVGDQATLLKGQSQPRSTNTFRFYTAELSH